MLCFKVYCQLTIGKDAPETSLVFNEFILLNKI